MIYKYGTYSHDEGEVILTVTRTLEFDAAARPYLWRIRHNLEGNLQAAAATQASMKTKIDALKAAYEAQGQNCGLYHDGGSVASSHVLTAADCLDGPRVVSMSFPEGAGVEYAPGGVRTYRIAIEATQYDDSKADVIAFTETLSFSGGGPEYACTTPRRGKGQRYQLTEYAPYTVTQQGSATGCTDYPTAPAPVFALPPDRAVDIARTSPQRYQDDYGNYRITWRYQWTVPDPLVGDPTTWL